MFGFMWKDWSVCCWAVLWTAKPNVNFWDNSWSHFPKFCSPSSAMIAENWSHISSAQIHSAILPCFIPFESLCRMLLWFTNLTGTHYFQLSLRVCVIVNMCILMAANRKLPLSQTLSFAFYSSFMIAVYLLIIFACWFHLFFNMCAWKLTTS